MRTGRPEHLKAFDYVGPHRYFLTWCTHSRAMLFTRIDHVHVVRTQIARAARESGMAVVAYCFMPDHVHLLVVGVTDAADCRHFIARAKQYSGFQFQQQFHVRLWQRYGFERTLRDVDSTIDVARYVLENPIRAGLVKRVDEYPFLGSDLYTIGEMVEAIQAS